MNRMMSEQELNDTYPSTDEQYLMGEILKRRFPLRDKTVKPKDSFNHWRIKRKMSNWKQSRTCLNCTRFTECTERVG